MGPACSFKSSIRHIPPQHVQNQAFDDSRLHPGQLTSVVFLPRHKRANASVELEFTHRGIEFVTGLLQVRRELPPSVDPGQKGMYLDASINLRKGSDGTMGELECDDLARSDGSTMRLDMDKVKGEDLFVVQACLLGQPQRSQCPDSRRCALQAFDLVAAARIRIVRHREEMGCLSTGPLEWRD